MEHSTGKMTEVLGMKYDKFLEWLKSGEFPLYELFGPEEDELS